MSPLSASIVVLSCMVFTAIVFIRIVMFISDNPDVTRRAKVGALALSLASCLPSMVAFILCFPVIFLAS